MPGTVPTVASLAPSGLTAMPLIGASWANCRTTAAVSAFQSRTMPSPLPVSRWPDIAGSSTSAVVGCAMPVNSLSGVTAGGAAAPSAGVAGSGRAQIRTTLSASAVASRVPPESRATARTSPCRGSLATAVPSSTFVVTTSPSRPHECTTAPSAANAMPVTAPACAGIVFVIRPVPGSMIASFPSVNPIAATDRDGATEMAVAEAESAISVTLAGGLRCQSLIVRKEPVASRSPPGAHATAEMTSRCACPGLAAAITGSTSGWSSRPDRVSNRLTVPPRAAAVMRPSSVIATATTPPVPTGSGRQAIGLPTAAATAVAPSAIQRSSSPS